MPEPEITDELTTDTQNIPEWAYSGDVDWVRSIITAYGRNLDIWGDLSWIWSVDSDERYPTFDDIRVPAERHKAILMELHQLSPGATQCLHESFLQTVGRAVGEIRRWDNRSEPFSPDVATLFILLGMPDGPVSYNPSPKNVLRRWFLLTRLATDDSFLPPERRVPAWEQIYRSPPDGGVQ